MSASRFHGPWRPVPDAASWVVFSLHNGRVICETYSRTVVDAVDRGHFGVATIQDWLAHHVREAA